MAGYPPLPEITGNIDLILDTWTHPSLSAQPNEQYGTSRRLAFLGSTVFNQAIAFHHFTKDPPLSVEDIEELRRSENIRDMMSHWFSYYNISSRLRHTPDTASRMGTPDEIQRFFHTYTGALFMSRGQKAVQDWISGLLDPEVPPPALPQEPSHQQAPMIQQASFSQPAFPLQPPAPSSPPPPAPNHAPPAYASSPSSNGLTPQTVQILATFNQTAQNRGYHVNYTAVSAGPPHLPVWTVKCLLNGEERGEGQGKSQKVAKEMAARMAWQNMGWGPLPM